jgi:hypothetical protein
MHTSFNFAPLIMMSYWPSGDGIWVINDNTKQYTVGYHPGIWVDQINALRQQLYHTQQVFMQELEYLDSVIPQG